MKNDKQDSTLRYVNSGNGEFKMPIAARVHKIGKRVGRLMASPRDPAADKGDGSHKNGGFERGGQTREHAMLVKTAGVKHLVVLINKMDDPTVGWNEARYNYCKDNLTPYLRKCGFNPSKDLKFMPVSGLTGGGIMEPVGSVAPWYT